MLVRFQPALPRIIEWPLGLFCGGFGCFSLLEYNDGNGKNMLELRAAARRMG